jgi:integral membrane protein
VLKSPIGRVRFVGMAEGVSFLLLLGVAMPLKYLADMPLAVRIVGMAHGLLFLLYVALIVLAVRAGLFNGSRALTLAVASLLPFGPFLVDRRLREDQAKAEAAPSPAG